MNIRLLPILLLVLSAVASPRLLHAQIERINLGPTVNSGISELQPIVTSDEQVLFFTRKGDPRNVGYATLPDDEDIWYSVRLPNGDWSEAVHLEGPLNTAKYDGVRAVNRTFTRLYLQNRYNPDGTRGKGFSASDRSEEGIWQFPVPLEIENYYNDTTIATLGVSNDENVLLLSLKRKDSKGGHDIYVSFRVGAYDYTEPKRVDALSTEGDEVAPFIGYDDRTIYLPSTGWDAENGAHDVFLLRRLDDTWLNWSVPEKLPFPINTGSADFYINFSALGDTCYLSSWHESSTRGFGRSDIWKAGVPQPYRPGTIAAMREGPVDGEGALVHIEPVPNVVPAEPAIGSLVRLDNIFFDTDKATLRPESKAALEKLRALLMQYPTMRIEIQGHTDSDGSDEHNEQLSGNRARSVRSYLVDNGIPAGRLEANGYGERMPIAPNTTAAGKQLNRRVMILITGYDFHE